MPSNKCGDTLLVESRAAYTSQVLSRSMKVKVGRKDEMKGKRMAQHEWPGRLAECVACVELWSVELSVESADRWLITIADAMCWIRADRDDGTTNT